MHRALTIAQMQGKFQMLVVRHSGHAIQVGGGRRGESFLEYGRSERASVGMYVWQYTVT